MMLKTICASLTLLLAACSMKVNAQNSSIGSPDDPAALMRLAHDKNGLIGSGINPWHIRGTYHSFDAKGAPEYEGVYEEWWISASRYKLSFKSPRATQTDYATGTVLQRDGSMEWQVGPELLLLGSLLDPLPDVSQLEGFTLQVKTQAVGKSTIDCVDLTYPMPLSPKISGGYYPSACFEPARPMLRVYSEGNSTRIIYDRIVLFQERYLARQIQIFVNGKLAADLNLNVIETLKQSPDPILAPPSTALPVDLTKISIKDGVRIGWPTALKKAIPLYPQEAKALRVEGTVHITAIVGINGHVEAAQLIDGPKLLRQPALDAINQWVYRPFDIMGQPHRFEVDTHVVFRLQ